MKKRENLSFCALWSRIKVVVMRRTRNAFVLRGTRVRIPPTPLVLCFGSACWQGLFYFFSDWFPAGIAFRRPLRLSAKNCSFRSLCGYCFSATVTSIREQFLIPVPRGNYVPLAVTSVREQLFKPVARHLTPPKPNSPDTPNSPQNTK